MTYELRYNPEAPVGSDDTVLYEGDDCWPASRRVETFGSLEEAMLALAAMGYELDGRDLSGTMGAFDVWNVRKFPGNSLERNGE